MFPLALRATVYTTEIPHHPLESDTKITIVLDNNTHICVPFHKRKRYIVPFYKKGERGMLGDLVIT